MRHKGIYIKIAQLFIAIGILFVLYTQIDIQKISALIHHTIPIYILLAFLILATQVIVAAYRWLLVVRSAGFCLPVWQCIGSFSASSLINSTLPVAIGGDIMRMWVTAHSGIPAGTAMYTVMSDRILNTAGLALLTLVGLLSSSFGISHLFAVKIGSIALLFSILLLGGFVGLLFIAPFLKYFNIQLPTFLRPFRNLSQILSMNFKNHRHLMMLGGNIFLGHFMLIVAIMCVAHGLQMGLGFTEAFIAIPIALLFSAVPITPGGWGIRESVMILALGQFQVDAEVALSISVLYGFCSTLASLPAAVLWYLSKYWTFNSNILTTKSVSE